MFWFVLSKVVLNWMFIQYLVMWLKCKWTDPRCCKRLTCRCIGLWQRKIQAYLYEFVQFWKEQNSHTNTIKCFVVKIYEMSKGILMSWCVLCKRTGAFTWNKMTLVIMNLNCHQIHTWTMWLLMWSNTFIQIKQDLTLWY